MNYESEFLLDPRNGILLLEIEPQWEHKLKVYFGSPSFLSLFISEQCRHILSANSGVIP